MADPQQVLAQRVRDAIVASFGPDYRDADPLIRPSAFADFQSNAALPLGKRLGRAPREVAAELAARLDVAAAHYQKADAAAQARIRTRSAREDWPARASPSASSVNTTISRSSSSASITLATPWRRTARM